MFVTYKNRDCFSKRIIYYNCASVAQTKDNKDSFSIYFIDTIREIIDDIRFAVLPITCNIVLLETLQSLNCRRHTSGHIIVAISPYQETCKIIHMIVI